MINCCLVMGLVQASQISPSAGSPQSRAMPRRMPKADSENQVKIDPSIGVVLAPTIARREGPARDVLHDGDGALADERDRLQRGARRRAWKTLDNAQTR